MAALAHELWSLKKMQGGWRHAQSYNLGARAHDALVAFDRLDEIDRRQALAAVESHTEPLLRDLEYHRGDNREFRLSEMKKGLQVGWARGVIGAEGAPKQASTIGQIFDWETKPAAGTRPGSLAKIRVRWPDGEITEHDPSWCDLRRIESLN